MLKNPPFLPILLLSAAVAGAMASYSRTSFEYVTFDRNKDEGSFVFSNKYAGIMNGALLLTPEAPVKGQNSTFYDQSGRVMYAKPFRMHYKDNVVSFNTTFVVNIFTDIKQNWSTGHGLAFLIAPNVTAPRNSHGRWLGLTNVTTDASPQNQILAVELDTFKDAFDPDGNHLGLNVNSVKSRNVVSLTPHNITLSPRTLTGMNHRVWVEYDGKSHSLEVFMAVDGEPKPDTAFVRESIDIKEYVNDVSYIGFSGSTGDPEVEINCVLKWKLDVEEPVKTERQKLAIMTGVGAPLVVTAVMVVVLIGSKWAKKRKREGKERNELRQISALPGMPREFKYRELKKATNGFNQGYKIGNGGFGVVYKGVLDCEKDRKEVAIKKFTRDSTKSKEDFMTELAVIHRLRHKNLVPLLGWCYEQGMLLLVYDFMVNGSLEKYLTARDGEQELLSWSRRYHILLGMASALQYLHNDYYQKVIHRDIKSSNILLDAEFNGRLGDFGLARIVEHDSNSYAEHNGVPGTLGYIAPECLHTGKATSESDVFAFGVLMLEVACGRIASRKIVEEMDSYVLNDWVWKLHREERILEGVDRRLEDVDEEQIERVMILGLACTHPMLDERPPTSSLLQILSGSLPPPRVPPFKPRFVWPSYQFSTSQSSWSFVPPSSREASGVHVGN